ncbi:hypothetical protein PHSY_001326 [Pseudozyma hubeiensis SY62]|uniref:Uncharacterized protein n=1 Tax=Pseudozyma hubeiensis (strain SY62) TaxID=1305764 RepID=R9NYK1_PSEHS|nr:hypothetical protein PHSY_001326 [Pseudozyma hubeiensis SY62]GAC93761.1 hypothetical protein PHSY_001326 [Pseudozyma hubeiensis SY62]
MGEGGLALMSTSILSSLFDERSRTTRDAGEDRMVSEFHRLTLNLRHAFVFDVNWGHTCLVELHYKREHDGMKLSKPV